jgi:UDP-N-acetylglucosamine transferase subunit ALG13
MIFVTVGHQMPFDRMIQLVDQWADDNPGLSIFAQIGESSYKPQHIDFAQLLSRQEYDAHLERCDAVVAHAGTGTIIQALLQNKPLLVFPRLSELAETRNDHQTGTARHFADKGQVLAAFDEQEFLLRLTEFQQFQPTRVPDESASPELLERLQNFLVESDDRN